MVTIKTLRMSCKEIYKEEEAMEMRGRELWTKFTFSTSVSLLGNNSCREPGMVGII